MAKSKAMLTATIAQKKDLQDAGPKPRVPAVLSALSLTLLIGLDGDLRLRCLLTPYVAPMPVFASFRGRE